MFFLVGLLLVGGGLLALGFAAEPSHALASMSIGDTEIEELYYQFRADWQDQPDGEEDVWQVSAEMRGDCEDFVLTFSTQLPSYYESFLVRMEVETIHQFLGIQLGRKSSGHIAAILFNTQTGEIWVLDNDWIVGLRGPFPPGLIGSSSPAVMALRQGQEEGQTGFLSRKREVTRIQISLFTLEREVFREDNSVLWQK